MCSKAVWPFPYLCVLLPQRERAGSAASVASAGDDDDAGRKAAKPSGPAPWRGLKASVFGARNKENDSKVCRGTVGRGLGPLERTVSGAEVRSCPAKLGSLYGYSRSSRATACVEAGATPKRGFAQGSKVVGVSAGEQDVASILAAAAALSCRRTTSTGPASSSRSLTRTGSARAASPDSSSCCPSCARVRTALHLPAPCPCHTASLPHCQTASCPPASLPLLLPHNAQQHQPGAARLARTP
jgi:hypothetical protein